MKTFVLFAGIGRLHRLQMTSIFHIWKDLQVDLILNFLTALFLLGCPAGTINAASLAANSFGIMVAKFMETLWAQQMRIAYQTVIQS
jgi:hypothetical protein